MDLGLTVVHGKEGDLENVKTLLVGADVFGQSYCLLFYCHILCWVVSCCV